MEDRISPLLYLELSPEDPDAYGVSRVPEVAALPGVERASWWADCVPGRRDLPRRLDDPLTLGVYEVTADFVAPPDGGGFLFRQVRPGQGTIGRSPTLGLEVVLISPRDPERAQELRDWGDFVHLHDIAAAAPEHFTMITPYENVEAGASPRYLHLYELDTDDPEPAFQAMTPATKAHLEAIGEGHRFKAWAWHEQLDIQFVSTFRRMGTHPGC